MRLTDLIVLSNSDTNASMLKGKEYEKIEIDV